MLPLDAPNFHFDARRPSPADVNTICLIVERSLGTTVRLPFRIPSKHHFQSMGLRPKIVRDRWMKRDNPKSSGW